MKTYWLECPCCGEDGMFERDEPVWYEGEEQKCTDCGCRLIVNVDDSDDEPRAYVTADESCDPALRGGGE